MGGRKIGEPPEENGDFRGPGSYWPSVQVPGRSSLALVLIKPRAMLKSGSMLSFRESHGSQM